MLCTPSTRCLLDGVAVRILRARVVAGVEFVKSTWDAAPRPEHAVLAAGEALEVTAAAHCRRSVLFAVRARLRVVAFCLRIARVVDSLQAGCSVHSLWAIAADAVLAGNSSSSETLIDAHNNLAIAVVGGRVQAPAKRATATEARHGAHDSNATCCAKQQRRTSPEGCYPSQSVAEPTERYSALASEEL